MMTANSPSIQNPAVRLVLQHEVKHGRVTMTDGWNPLRFILGVGITVAVVLVACALAPAEFRAPVFAGIFAIGLTGIVVTTWWMVHGDDRATAATLAEWAARGVSIEYDRK